MPEKPCGWLLLATGMLSTMLGAGCGKKPAPQPVDRAEKIVETFLDSWSRGASPEKFTSPKQPIDASDPDWQAGYRLLSFLSIESRPTEGTPDRFRCRVALSLQDRAGKSVDKEVEYDVQIGTRCIISRVSP